MTKFQRPYKKVINIKYFLLVLLILVGCGQTYEDEKPLKLIIGQEKLAALQKKYDLYLELSRTQTEASGFIETSSCDSLLFSSLYGVGGGEVNVEVAKNSENQWFRRPLYLPECYASKESASTISQDMFLGLFWNLWYYKRLDLAEEIYHYGIDHKWDMGGGDAFATGLSVGNQELLAKIIKNLGGEDFTSNYNSSGLLNHLIFHNTGFAAHLDVLKILLEGEVDGKVYAFKVPENPLSKGLLYRPAYILGNLAIQKMKTISVPEDFSLLKSQNHRQPNNALFSYAYHKYADGDQNETVDLLLNNAWWPEDRLPTNRDRKDPWLFQRDYGSDWQPDLKASETITHSGGDFLFVAKLILDDLKSGK